MPRSLEYIKEEIDRVSVELGIHPRSPSYTRTAFLKRSDVTRHDLDSYGGFAKLKVDVANDDSAGDIKVQPQTRGVELRNNYLRKLERQAASTDYFHNKVISSFEDLLKSHPVVLSAKSVQPVKKKHNSKRVLTLLLSDIHFGVDVLSYEVHGASYNWEVSSRRMASICESALAFAEEHEITHLRIVLNGDIMHGVIHLDDSNIKPMTEQIWGAASILIHAVDYLRKWFTKIDIVGLPGNHDRMTYKNTGRSTCQRWDSHAHSLYLAIKMAFRQDKSISVEVPTSGIGLLDDLNGGYMLATHGDTEPDPKNVSKKIDASAMAVKLVKLQHSAAVDKHISVAMFGHWHTPTAQMLPSGSMMLVNGCLIGSEPYGQNVVGEFNNEPAQIMFSSTSKEPIEMLRFIKVRHADADPKFDKIIPVPQIISDAQLTVEE